jgi:transposase
MAFLLNSLKKVIGVNHPLTLGMAVIESDPLSDFLEFDNLAENNFLQYNQYDPTIHRFIILVIYLRKLGRWICSV